MLPLCLPSLPRYPSFAEIGCICTMRSHTLASSHTVRRLNVQGVFAPTPKYGEYNCTRILHWGGVGVYIVLAFKAIGFKSDMTLMLVVGPLLLALRVSFGSTKIRLFSEN